MVRVSFLFTNGKVDVNTCDSGTREYDTSPPIWVYCMYSTYASQDTQKNKYLEFSKSQVVMILKPQKDRKNIDVAS